MNLRLLLFTFSIGLNKINAQQLHTRHYGITDGLDNTEVYEVFELKDRLYMQNGYNLISWDGYEWKNNPEEAISTNGFIRVEFQAEEFIIFRYLSENPYILFDGTNFISIESPNNKKTTATQVNESLFITTEDFKVYEFHISDTTFHHLNTLDINYEPRTIRQIHSYPEQDAYKISFFDTEKKAKVFKHENEIRTTPKNDKIYITDDGNIWIQSNNQNFLNYKTHSSKNPLNFNIPRRDNTIKGVIQYIPQDSFFTLLTFSSKDFINKLYELNYDGTIKNLGKFHKNHFLFPTKINGSFWTFGHEGISRIDPWGKFFSSSEKEMATSLHFVVEDAKGTIWFGGYGSGLSSYSKETLKKERKFSAIEAKFLPGAHLHIDDALYAFNEGAPTFCTYKNGSWRSLEMILSSGDINTYAGYYTTTLRDGRLALGLQNHCLGIVDSIGQDQVWLHTIGKEKGIELGNVLCISQDSKGRIWTGRSSKGIAIYDEQKDQAYTFHREPNNEKSFGVMSMVYDNNHTLWLGGHNGLYYLENAHLFDPIQDDFFGAAQKLLLPDGNDNLVSSLLIMRDWTLVIGSHTKSIGLLNLDDFYKNQGEPFIYQLYYGEDIAGEGTEQNCLFEDSNGFLWVGSQTGANRIDLNRMFRDTLQNKIQINKIQSGKGPLQETDESYDIPTDSRSLSIKYGLNKNPSLRKSTFFDRYLINSDGDTIETKKYDQEGRLEINYIEPGDYNLVIQAKKHGQLIDEKVIKINAPLALSENPLFWICLIALMSLATIAFIIFRNKQKQKILERDLQLSKLEQEKNKQQVQAIISSFNPHFINNSLHWAQSRYHDDNAFTKVIGRLSANIRYIFEKTRSGKSYHTIAEELDLVRNYLSIQKERFSDENYIFNIPTKKQIEQFGAYNILLMHIQILIENAVEHGLRNSLTARTVQLNFTENTDYVIAKITDDGIGRGKAKLINSHGTQQGLLMIQSLHKIYNEQNKTKLKIEYQDGIFSKGGEAFGTSVQVFIPKDFNYDL